jgi:hypothetical protein
MVEGKADRLVDQLGRQEIAGVLAGDGRQLDAVDRDDLPIARDRPYDIERLHPGKAAWLGCAGRRDQRRIEAIQIDRQKQLAAAHNLGQRLQMPAGLNILGEPDP